MKPVCVTVRQPDFVRLSDLCPLELPNLTYPTHPLLSPSVSSPLLSPLSVLLIPHVTSHFPGSPRKRAETL